jgi:hypothetical protein
MYERLAVLSAQSAAACIAKGWTEMAELHLDTAERNRHLAALARERIAMHTPRDDAEDTGRTTSGPPGRVSR